MKSIVCGAGVVGQSIAESLSKEGLDVTVIDESTELIQKVSETGLNLQGATMASDAFFPFSDSIEIAARAGISTVVQPGGSIKDAEVIKKANELGVAMVFTKIRHFLH